MSKSTTYTVLAPVEGAPDKPMRYELEVFAGDTELVFRQSQDGFWGFTDMFVDLEALKQLGAIAEALLDNSILAAEQLADEVKTS